MTTSIASEPDRVWVEIDRSALLANARTIAASAGVPLCPMIKADAYGLGAVEVARTLEAIGPWGFGVATLDEAEALRRAGISRPIVVFTPLAPSQVERTLALGLRPLLCDLEGMRAWLARGAHPFHLGVDTGMGRVGFHWTDPALVAEAGRLVGDAPGWEGIATHFHSADSDAEATAAQWRRFEDVIGALPRRPAMVHAANSAGALRGRMYAGDLVRPGIFLYGGPVGEWAPAPRPVAALKARVVAVRQLAAGETVSYGATWRAPAATTIATLALGYADGMHRSGAGRARVELHGRPIPVVGRITMDLTMVAVPDGRVQVGDVATVFGGAVSLAEHAAALGTISYEVLTSMSARVVRSYHS
ncbi:MAG TPA: alanine racemase [Gemmatimonadales bacterium]|nr:alanine racemase [Gemmatimonadales bacterium]